MRDDLLALTAELAEIVRLVEDDDVGSALERVVVRVVRTVPGCDHAAIFIRSDGAVELVASSAEGGPDALQPGPIIEALAFNEPRRLDDTATDQRWPAFSARLAAAGYRSCVVLPLPNHADPSGVLVLYSSAPDPFGDTSFDLALLFALHAGVAFDNVSLYEDSRRIVEQLHAALRSRALIGRAQGLVMHRYGHGTVRSFDVLRTASQHRNIKLRELATRLVAAHERGELDAALEEVGIGDQAGGGSSDG
jgi:GAF domain-containing protein